MDIGEKILQLRKANNLTQEQLAERLDVTRQSISKWESGQAVPEIDKILALSEIFHVTTDSLLRPSELDELSLKTEILEKKQQELISETRKRQVKHFCILSCLGIYLIAIAIIMLIRQFSWSNTFLWDSFPGATLPIIVLLIATAAAIYVCLRILKRDKNT